MENNNMLHAAAAFPRKVQLVLGINLDWIWCRRKCLRPPGNRFLVISFLLGHFAVRAILVYQQTCSVLLPLKGTNINLICGCFFKRSYIYIYPSIGWLWSRYKMALHWGGQQYSISFPAYQSSVEETRYLHDY